MQTWKRTVAAMLGLVAGCLVAACSTAPAATPGPGETPEPGDRALTMRWDGAERTYEMHAPPGYRAGDRLPLVMVLHGFGGSAANIHAGTTLDALADHDGFLVAYPDAIDGSWNSLDCCGSSDDVGFLRALVTHLVATWGADPDRVYAAGFSQGAELTYRLAVETPGLVAAIAPVAAGFSMGGVAAPDSYRPATPVSVVAFYGTADPYVEAIETGLAVWDRRVGCPSPGPSSFVDADHVVSRSQTTCGNGTDVVAYRVDGMGHAWPGPSGHPTAIDADAIMWAFFAAHPRRSA